MRFYKPSIASWKFVDTDKGGPIVKGAISKEEKDTTIRKNLKFFDWQLSFTKTCVQIAFIIFVIANVYILTMLTINFCINNTVDLFEGYINNVFTMFENVIGGYIIKSATENALKITMSVLSDYVERKYGTALIRDNESTYYEDEVCDAANIDNDTYNELINSELNQADISTVPEDDIDFAERFAEGTEVMYTPAPEEYEEVDQ